MCACFIIRITNIDDLTTEETDTVDAQASGRSVALSLIQQPRIVFTGVSGAVMIKMKEVSRHLCFVSAD